jgi:hypothetical protein
MTTVEINPDLIEDTTISLPDGWRFFRLAMVERARGVLVNPALTACKMVVATVDPLQNPFNLAINEINAGRGDPLPSWMVRP